MRELDLTYKTPPVSSAMQTYNRKYREAHDYTVECVCGAIFKAISVYTHQHSQRHKAFMEAKLAATAKANVEAKAAE